MYHDLSLDDFVEMLTRLGMERMALVLDDEGVTFMATIDYAGIETIILNKVTETIEDLMEACVREIRQDLLGIADFDGLDAEGTAGVLTSVAILDEFLNGPSTGIHPGQQALGLDDSEETS